jgi:alpha-ribazole phosphatase/probable phosphoglycerate mutase
VSTTISTTVDLMRHGEPVGGRRYRGQRDDPLSERGWAQMRAAVGDQCPWSAVISSPLSRCAAFGRELAARHDLPLTLDGRLQELGFGDWEGRTAEELMRDDPQRLMRFWHDPVAHRPPGGEALGAFRERVVGAWESLLAAHAGRQVLVICHAGVIRMIVRHVLDMPLDRLFRIQVPSAGLTRIRVDGAGAEALPRLMFHAGSL